MTLPTVLTASRVFALVGLAVTIAGVLGTALVRYVSPAPFIAVGFGFGGVAMVGYLIAGLTWASIGALLVVRRPDNAVGWLMVLIGVGYALSQLSVSLVFTFAAEGTAEGERRAQIAAWVTVLLNLVAVFQVAIGFIFPSGRPQSPGWAQLMRLYVAFAIVFVVISLSQPGPLQIIPGLHNPFGFGPDLRGDRPIAPIFIVSLGLVFAGLAVSMISRYRSAGVIERHQLKWFVLALGASAIGLAIIAAETIVINRPNDAIGLNINVFAGAIVPVAIGIAILRYRLYDIDRIISRTISYAAITAMLAGVFGLVGVSLGVVLGSLAEGETIAVAGSTLFVAALFGPLRRRAQLVVDRRFDRARYDASRTVQSMTDRLRDDVDLARVEADVIGVVDRTFHPATAAMWLRRASR
jgi:hypothetical protein